MQVELVLRTCLHGIMIIVLGMLQTTVAVACPICIGFPKKTDADFLLESHCVMLGRPDPSNTFQYAAGPVLKGSYDQSSIDLLVDNATQRALEVHPECYVLLIQEHPQGPWRSLGWMSPSLEAIVRRILIVGPTWDGPDAIKHRVDFFVPLLGHEEKRIGELAYLELGRAPYSMVRELGRLITREAYEPMLQEQRYMEWRGLAILLLAQSDSESDRQRIRESFLAAQQFSISMNLSAWAAAAIEIEPDEAIDQIEESYFQNAHRTREELQAIFIALSMHGSRGDTKLRERIIASYEKLLQCHSDFAPQVAKDLATWKRIESGDVVAHASGLPHD